MPRRRTVIALAFCSSLFSITGTVAAQSENRDVIDGLNFQLLYVALPLSLFVIMILIYAAVKFYDNDDPQPTAEDPALEITWTAATAIILLFVGVSGYTVLVSPYVSPQQPADLAGGETTSDLENLPETDHVEVHVNGYQWGWEVTHENNVTTQNEIVIPVDEDVTLWLTTEDVIHSLFVSDLGIKQDAFPGEYTRATTLVYETGEYEGVCVEFCGAGHSRMDITIVVLEQDEYETWLEENAESEGTAPTVS